MHVSIADSDLSINIFHFSPVMRTVLLACGIFILLDNLKNDIIYGRTEINSEKIWQAIRHIIIE